MFRWIFVEQLRVIKFPDYSTNNCANDAYQEFATKFWSVIDFVAPIRTLRVKYNTKPWFDIKVWGAIRNRDLSTIENSNDQAKKLTKAISNVQSFYLKNLLITS